MSRGTLEGGRSEPGKNANTKAFDGLARHGWREHGLITLHFMDGRWPQFVRDYLIERMEKKYGRRL